MASLSAVILPAKALKDGKHKVRISVAHNGETRYILTNIIIDSQAEFAKGCVRKRPDAAALNTKIRGLLNKYQTAIDEQGYIDGLSCAELVAAIKLHNRAISMTLEELFEDFIAHSTAQKQATITRYHSNWRTITKYIPSTTILRQINLRTIINLDTELHKQRYANASIQILMTFISTMLNYAIRCQYVEYKVRPFLGYAMPKPAIRNCWLSVEQIKTVRDLELSKPRLRLCRDLIMLSYYLGGINIVDLEKINFNVQSKTIKYIRQKTERKPKANPFVEFDIPDEAKLIIERYKDTNGFLKKTGDRRYADIFRHNVPLLRELTGINNLIYYSARKSFAQHAFKLGISTSVIDYILGHKLDAGGTSLYSYISVTPEMASKAIRTVLDNLK